MRSRVMLHGIEETITRPVLISVTNDIKKMLGIGHDVFTFFDPEEKLKRSKNELGEVIHNNTQYEEYALAELEEVSEDNNELDLTVIRPETYPIYEDTEIGAKISTITHRRRFNINFTYRNKSKSAVMAMANKLKLGSSSDGYYRRHEIEYSYTIPYYVLELISHFNDLRNKRLEDIEKLEFEDYITKTFDDRVTVGATHDAQPGKVSIAIREAIVHLEGYITDSVHDLKPEYDEAETNWTLSFGYTITFDKPVALLLDYQLLVWNSLIDARFRTFDKQENPTNRAHYNKSMGSVSMLSVGHPIFHTRPRKEYFTIPIEDERMNILDVSYLTRMFSVMCVVDPDDPTLLFNIDEIPNYKFKPSILNLLRTSEYSHVGVPYGSLIFISLFDGKNELSFTNRVTMSKDGTLRSTLPLNIKKTYRVMFSVLNDLELLHNDSKKRIEKYIARELEIYRDKKKSLRSFPEGKNVSGMAPLRTNGEFDVGSKDEVVIDIYADILQVDYNDVLDNLNPNPVQGILFRISNRYRHNMKTVAIHSLHTAMLIDLQKELAEK